MYMRKLFLLLALGFFSDFGYAQQLDSLKSTTPIEVYKKRRTTYNTIGWAMLGTGVALAGYSFYDYAVKKGYNGTWELEPLFYTGGGMAIASIPFFILARHNKIKAGLALKKERLLPATVFSKLYYPALSFHLHW